MDIDNQEIASQKKGKFWKIIGIVAILVIVLIGILYFWKPLLILQVDIEDKKDNYELGETITANIRITNYSFLPFKRTFSSTNTDPSFRIDGIKPKHHLLMAGAGFTTVKFKPFESKNLTVNINLVNSASWVNDAGLMSNYDLVFKPGENKIIVEWVGEVSETIYIKPDNFYEEKINCDLFSNPTRQDQCNYEFSFGVSDIESCRKLHDDFLKANCYGDFAAKNEDPSVCEDLKNTDDKDDCIYDVYYKTNDPKYCELLSIPGGCFSQHARKVKDDSYCEKITIAEIKDNCYLNLSKEDIANEEFCKKIVSVEAKDSCYKNLVRYVMDDYSLCEKITNNGERSSCHFVFCLKFEGEEKNACYIDIALKLNDSRPCDLIKAEDEKADCHAQLDKKRKEGAKEAEAQMLSELEADAFMRLKANPQSIKDFKNPAEKFQIVAVEIDPATIKYIENPTEAVQLLSIQAHPMNVIYIKNPTEKVQTEVANSDPEKLKFLLNMKEDELSSYYEGMGARINIDSFKSLIDLINSKN